MTQEQLIAAGLTAEQAKAVLDLHKQSVTDNYVPKARFDEVNTELGQTKGQVKERDTQISQLQKFQGTAEELSAKVAELSEANKQATAEMEKALAAERLTAAMKMALTGKVHDVDLALSQIDASKVSTKDGALLGFEEQVNQLKTQKAFLFKDEAAAQGQRGAPGYRVAGATPPDGSGQPPAAADPEALGKKLAEQRLAAMKAAQAADEHYFK